MNVLEAIARMNLVPCLSGYGIDEGCEVQRGFAPVGRYMFDNAILLSPRSGWRVIQTELDAGHFGVWVNDTRLERLTYESGIWTLITAPDVSTYRHLISGYDAVDLADFALAG